MEMVVWSSLEREEAVTQKTLKMRARRRKGRRDLRVMIEKSLGVFGTVRWQDKDELLTDV